MIEICLGFLSATGAKQSLQISGEQIVSDYLRNILLLEEELPSSIEKVIQLKLDLMLCCLRILLHMVQNPWHKMIDTRKHAACATANTPRSDTNQMIFAINFNRQWAT